MDQLTFTREDFYNLVWSESIISLSRRFSVSDVGIRKICIRMDIPLPKAGYWEKVKAGKILERQKLPIGNGKYDSVILTVRKEGESGNDDDNPLKKLKRDIQTTEEIDLSVPERLHSNDKRILDARDSFAERKRYLNNGLITAGIDRLDMKVSPGNVSRALRFMDTLIKLLQWRGHSIVVSGDTYVMVKDERMKILLRERLRIGEKTEPWGSHNYIPTGKLYFKLDSYPQREWKDGKVLIEGQMADIVARLEIQGNEMLARQVEWRKERLAQEERKQLKKELEDRKLRELSEFKTMILKSKRWHKAVNLRLYLDAIEAKANKDGKLSLEMVNWLKWARKKADWYDPFIEEVDDLLIDVDREKMTLSDKNVYSWD